MFPTKKQNCKLQTAKLPTYSRMFAIKDLTPNARAT